MLVADPECHDAGEQPQQRENPEEAQWGRDPDGPTGTARSADHLSLDPSLDELRGPGREGAAALHPPEVAWSHHTPSQGRDQDGAALPG